MTSLFISYSRKDNEFARKLTDAFKAQGLDFWIDWEGIPPTVDWWKEIERGIERANIFVFLISPDSAKSKVCGQEIEHAVKNGKRLIPVVVRDVEAEESPNDLQPLNWIFLREGDIFDQGFDKLITAIKTDYEWVQAHSQLQVKALEWERTNKENSFLLRGKELQEAELQLATNSIKEPYPTELQHEYVLKSRQATDRQRRITTSISIAGIIALAALAVFGFVQAGRATANEKVAVKNASTAQAASTLAFNNAATAQANAEEAQRQAILSRSSQLGSQAQSLLGSGNPIQAFRLNYFAIESLRNVSNSQATLDLLSSFGSYSSLAISPDGRFLAATLNDKISLWDTKSTTSDPLILHGHTASIQSVAFSPDSRFLASGGFDSTIIIWDLKNLARPSFKTLLGHSSFITDIEFSPNGRFIVSSSADNTVLLWDVITGQLIGKPFVGTDVITSIAINPDGKILASGSVDYSIVLWNAESGQVITTLFDIDMGEINSVAFSPDAKLLAATGTNGFSIWDLTNTRDISQLFINTLGNYNEVTFSQDGGLIAVGSSDHIIYVWNIKKLDDPPIIVRTNDDFSSIDWLH